MKVLSRGMMNESVPWVKVGCDDLEYVLWGEHWHSLDDEQLCLLASEYVTEKRASIEASRTVTSLKARSEKLISSIRNKSQELRESRKEVQSLQVQLDKLNSFIDSLRAALTRGLLYWRKQKEFTSKYCGLMDAIDLLNKPEKDHRLYCKSEDG